MGEVTEIGWTDHTFNPWWGCTKIAPGCTNCYAAAFSKRTGRAEWGDSGTRVKTSEANWRKPLKWNRDAEKASVRKRVFCASMADVFEDWRGPVTESSGQYGFVLHDEPDCYGWSAAPVVASEDRLLTLDDLRRDLFTLIDQTPWLTWQLLTKRPENILRMWPLEKVRGHVSQNEGDGWTRKCLANVWLGTSISDQATADQNIPELLKCRDLCPVLFVSAEPLLGPVNLRRFFSHSIHCSGYRGGRVGFLPSFCDCGRPNLRWLIIGGESGSRYRPCQVEWIADLARQCQAAEVPVFIKQDAGRFPGQQGRIPDDLWALKQFPGLAAHQETA